MRNLKNYLLILIGNLLVILGYLLVIVFFPILWIKYRLFPYQKKSLQTELVIKFINLSSITQTTFETLLLHKRIYRETKADKLPSSFYISKKDYAKISEHLKTLSEKTVLATLEVNYWKFGFGKSKLISFELLDKRPLILK